MDIKNMAMKLSTIREKCFSFARKSISRVDLFIQRVWEIKSYYFPKTLSHGEMTARLRRMGFQGFTEYILWQKKGGFNRTFLPDKITFLQTIKKDFPYEAKKIVATANRCVEGQFQLLGSELVNMHRKWVSKIDWNKDLITGHRYRRIFDFRRWNQTNVQVGKPDIKGCWEMGRLQHFVTLGQAYWLTNNEKYARCFADTVTDFIKKNPVGNGVQWACPMDVALRVVSLIQGVHFFQGSPVLTFSWWKRFLKSLVEHGQFIANHFEFGTLNGGIVTSNHYLSNLFGLYWLAMAFPGLDAGCVWRGLTQRGLEHEMQYQMHPDGGNFESSTSYHLLVTEMFLSAYTLANFYEHPFSESYRNSLFQALHFIKSIRQSDGRIPQIGDADSGRAHIFSHYGELRPDSADHLLAAGSRVFNCPELASYPNHHLEMLFWPVCIKNGSFKISIPSANLLTHSGIAILSNQKACAILANTPSGTKGYSNHKHNDQLGVEWTYAQQPILVDPGSYTYTRVPELRNLFRATSMHNTVLIENEEQNRFNPEWLFRMENDAQTSLSVHELDKELAAIGMHTGYQRPPLHIRHQRTLLLLSNGEIKIEDHFDGKGEHQLTWHFLFYPGCQVEIKNNVPIISTLIHQFQLICESNIAWKVQSSWYSSGYGLREDTVQLIGYYRGEVHHLKNLLHFSLI